MHGRHGAARSRAQQAVRMARSRDQLKPMPTGQTPARFPHQQVAQAIERRHVWKIKHKKNLEKKLNLFFLRRFFEDFRKKNTLSIAKNSF
jgi:hypothetical protein